VSQLPLADLGEQQVAACSAAVLRALVNTFGENHQGFPVRAGVPAQVVAEAAAKPPDTASAADARITGHRVKLLTHAPETGIAVARGTLTVAARAG
jgi:hypothetical protein